MATYPKRVTWIEDDSEIRISTSYLNDRPQVFNKPDESMDAVAYKKRLCGDDTEFRLIRLEADPEVK